MKTIPTDLPGVLLLEPRVFADNRGFFYESYNRRSFREATGYDVEFERVIDQPGLPQRRQQYHVHYPMLQNKVLVGTIPPTTTSTTAAKTTPKKTTTSTLRPRPPTPDSEES